MTNEHYHTRCLCNDGCVNYLHAERNSQDELEIICAKRGKVNPKDYYPSALFADELGLEPASCEYKEDEV